jgi:fatty acid desaturase
MKPSHVELPSIPHPPEPAAQVPDRRALVRGLEPELSMLHRLSAGRRAVELVSVLVLYLLGAGLMLAGRGSVNGLVLSTTLVLLAVAAMGLAFNALGILIHDGLHGLLARGPVTNRLLAFCIGLPLLISASAYRVTHTHHHLDFGRKLDYGTYRQHTRHVWLVWLAYLIQLTIGSLVYVTLIPFLALRSATAHDRLWILAEYVVIAGAAGGVIALVPLSELLWYWLLPMLVMNVLTNLRGLASHALGDVHNIYLSSRTVRCSRPVALLLFNENYHLEHHLFPGIPSYHLGTCHRLIWDRLPEALYARSYGDFLWQFLRAAWRRDLSPRGVVYPRQTHQLGPSH